MNEQILDLLSKMGVASLAALGDYYMARLVIASWVAGGSLATVVVAVAGALWAEDRAAETAQVIFVIAALLGLGAFIIAGIAAASFYPAAVAPLGSLIDPVIAK